MELFICLKGGFRTVLTEKGKLKLEQKLGCHIQCVLFTVLPNLCNYEILSI